MTRYVCTHPSHARAGRTGGVDVSDQVRLERELAPKGRIYLAYTERVVAQVADLPPGPARVDEVTSILAGGPATTHAPVMLVSERSGLDRAAGLYATEELRGVGPVAERLLDRFARSNVATPRSDDLVILDDRQATEEARGPVLTTTRSHSVPQGVYPVRILAARLADAPADEASLEEAIRDTPPYGRIRSNEVSGPWRVVITCPEAEDDDPAGVHRTTFTGTGDPDPAVVYGTPADGWDLLLEDAAAEDLDPSRALESSERRLQTTLLAEGALTAVLIAVAWASGALGFAARETPGWLGFGITMAAAALVFGGVALYGPRAPERNANDTLVLGQFYRSRLETLWWAGMISAALFVVALMTSIVPPVLAGEAPIPAPTITFDATQPPVTATVVLTTRDLGGGDTVVIEMHQYASFDGEPSLVGRVSATGNAAGADTIRETVALDEGARFLAVLVKIEGRAASTCTPSASSGPGCTVVAVPPLGAGIVRAVTAVVVPSPSAAPTPSVVPSPSAVMSPSPSV